MASVQVESGCQNRNVTGRPLSFQALSQALGTRWGPGQETLTLPPWRDTNEGCSQVSKDCPKVSLRGREGSLQVPGTWLSGKPFSTASTPPAFSPTPASFVFFSEPTKESASYLSILLRLCGGAGP